MSYYHISEELNPEVNLENEKRFFEQGFAPMLFLWESRPAVITSGAKKSASLPIIKAEEGPSMLGGYGAAFFSLYCESALEKCLKILKDTMTRLEIQTEINNGRLFSGGYKFCTCFEKAGGKYASGVIYYAADQKELSKASSILGEDYMSLSLVSRGLSKSFLFGALRYSFEVEFGKSEFARLREEEARALSQ